MRQVVSSSNLAAVDYNDNDQSLVVEFVNGTSYRYKSVNRAEYENLLSAKSVGQYFIKNIRNNYEFEKVS